MIKNATLFFLLLIAVGCRNNNTSEQNRNLAIEGLSDINVIELEAITLTNDSIFSGAKHNDNLLKKYYEAKTSYENKPDNEEAIIWYGRRTAYLQKYQNAIKIFSKGIELYPDNPEMYRHRGHRYISTRQYNKAVSDFKIAAKLIEGTEDQVEMDGAPNSLNIPISSLHGNIWYHLGLAYYLQHDFENAALIYEQRFKTHKNDDNIVSASYWYYMTLLRLGRIDEAQELLEPIKPAMNVIENTRYYEMCLFFKGLLSRNEIEIENPEHYMNDVLHYGLANIELYLNNDKEKAKEYLEIILNKGSKFSFTYLAAESDYKRLFD